jgi:hypothetical protein
MNSLSSTTQNIPSANATAVGRRCIAPLSIPWPGRHVFVREIATPQQARTDSSD